MSMRRTSGHYTAFACLRRELREARALILRRDKAKTDVLLHSVEGGSGRWGNGHAEALIDYSYELRFMTESDTNMCTFRNVVIFCLPLLSADINSFNQPTSHEYLLKSYV
jgi:hypothetical protein